MSEHSISCSIWLLFAGSAICVLLVSAFLRVLSPRKTAEKWLPLFVLWIIVAPFLLAHFAYAYSPEWLGTYVRPSEIPAQAQPPFSGLCRINLAWFLLLAVSLSLPGLWKDGQRWSILGGLTLIYALLWTFVLFIWADYFLGPPPMLWDVFFVGIPCLVTGFALGYYSSRELAYISIPMVAVAVLELARAFLPVSGAVALAGYLSFAAFVASFPAFLLGHVPVLASKVGKDDGR